MIIKQFLKELGLAPESFDARKDDPNGEDNIDGDATQFVDSTEVNSEQESVKPIETNPIDSI